MKKFVQHMALLKKIKQGRRKKNKNIAYTRFVLEKGYSGDFFRSTYSLDAMCFRLCGNRQKK